MGLAKKAMMPVGFYFSVIFGAVDALHKDADRIRYPEAR
jgi:hypothetical protein